MSRSSHIRAALVLGVILLELLLAFPGLDKLGPSRVNNPKWRARAQQFPLGGVALMAGDLNVKVRAPITGRIDPLLKVLRTDQSWHLYGAGERRLRRLEIDIDDELAFRSNDPEHQWLQPVLEYRRARQLSMRLCGSSETKGRRAYLRWIASRAQEDTPGAQVIMVRCTSEPWPGDLDAKPARTDAAFRLHSPDWAVEEGR